MSPTGCLGDDGAAAEPLDRLQRVVDARHVHDDDRAGGGALLAGQHAAVDEAGFGRPGVAARPGHDERVAPSPGISCICQSKASL